MVWKPKGLVGSATYLNKPTWPLESTLAVINFDMVGRNFFEAGADKAGTVAVIGLEDHDGARQVAEAAAEAVGLELVVVPAQLLEVFGQSFRTDDWRFRRTGKVAIHFSTGYHDDYHQPTDTPDKLVPGQLERIARTNSALLDFLAGKPADVGK